MLQILNLIDDSASKGLSLFYRQRGNHAGHGRPHCVILQLFLILGNLLLCVVIRDELRLELRFLIGCLRVPDTAVISILRLLSGCLRLIIRGFCLACFCFRLLIGASGPLSFRLRLLQGCLRRAVGVQGIFQSRIIRTVYVQPRNIRVNVVDDHRRPFRKPVCRIFHGFFRAVFYRFFFSAA